MTISTQSLAQLAQQAATANSLVASAGATASTFTSVTGENALQQLGSNFNQFLSLLTTQLKNQDPTSPMDTNQFTQELVQFTGVQQSVATNTNLTQLIKLQQGSEVLQSTSVVGHKVIVTAGQIALQNGGGRVDFTAPASEKVQLAIVDASGKPIRNVAIEAQAGNNTWTWNGQDDLGNQVPEGAYGIALETGTGSAPMSQPFSVVGTATGLVNSVSGMQIDIGSLAVGLDKVKSLMSE